MRKLYIYDSSSSLDRKQAAGRFDGDNTGIATAGVGSVTDLHKMLERLLKKGLVFDRVLFQTHGGPGRIVFNHERIGARELGNDFAGKGYDKLFQKGTRLHFDGCNVAEGNAGWTFLELAGNAFLRSGGGVSFGWTSLGGGFPGWIPFIGGHTVHLTGKVRKVTIDSAGKPSEWIEDAGAVQTRRYPLFGS